MGGCVVTHPSINLSIWVWWPCSFPSAFPTVSNDYVCLFYQSSFPVLLFPSGRETTAHEELPQKSAHCSQYITRNHLEIMLFMWVPIDSKLCRNNIKMKDMHHLDSFS